MFVWLQEWQENAWIKSTERDCGRTCEKRLTMQYYVSCVSS